MKTTLRLRSVVIEQCRNVSVALTLCIMLLTPLLFLGEGLGVRCVAQVANGTGAGNCLSYDGVNDYVCFSPNGLLNTTYTYSLWINAFYLPTNGSASGIFIIGDNTLDQAIILSNNYAFLYNGWHFASYNTDGTSFTITTGSVPETNRWYHIAVMRDNSNIKMYVNGVLVNTISTSGKTAGFNTGTFARTRRDGNLYFNGLIDELSIWNRALTETEIRDNMCKKLTGSESGLVGYWRFDEGSGSTAYDASPNGNNGTLY